MIETYGVDTSPVKQDEEYKEIKDNILFAYTYSLGENEKTLARFRDVKRSCERLGDLIERYQKTKLELRNELRFVDGMAPLPVSLILSNLPSDVKLEDASKKVVAVVEHISKGLEVMKPFVDMFLEADERLDAKYEMAERNAAADKRALLFWQSVLEQFELEYVFAHAEMKYKKKACRECLKKARAILAGAEVELERMKLKKKPDGSNHPLVSFLEPLIKKSRNRVKVFTQIRDEADAKGIESAFKIWQDAKFVRG